MFCILQCVYYKYATPVAILNIQLNIGTFAIVEGAERGWEGSLWDTLAPRVLRVGGYSPLQPLPFRPCAESVKET